MNLFNDLAATSTSSFSRHGNDEPFTNDSESALDQDTMASLWSIPKNSNTVSAIGALFQDAKTAFASDWLRNNYEACDGVSVARCVLYEHYLQACNQLGYEAINSASFGKIIRSVFPALKTRRLGTRGHSRYHYYGIRPKNLENQFLKELVTHPERSMRGSRSNTLGEIGRAIALGTQQASSFYSLRNSSIDSTGIGALLEENDTLTGPQPSISTARIIPGSVGDDGSALATERYSDAASSLASSDESVGRFSFSPESFLKILCEVASPSIENMTEAHFNLDRFYLFLECYRVFCLNYVTCVLNRNFSELNTISGSFWNQLVTDHAACLEMREAQRLISLSDDYTLYVLTEALAGDVLSDSFNAIPIKGFVKFLESDNSYLVAPSPIRMLRYQGNTRAVIILKRRIVMQNFYSLAKNILIDDSQLALLLREWELIDFEAIGDSVRNALFISETLVAYVQQGVKIFLETKAPLDKWIEWIKVIAENCIMRSSSNSSAEAIVRHFLQRWSYFVSQVIRDLTLRNSPGFASFHLIRSFLDEFVHFYASQRLERMLQTESGESGGDLHTRSTPDSPSSHRFKSKGSVGGGGASASADLQRGLNLTDSGELDPGATRGRPPNNSSGGYAMTTAGTASLEDVDCYLNDSFSDAVNGFFVRSNASAAASEKNSDFDLIPCLTDIYPAISTKPR